MNKLIICGLLLVSNLCLAQIQIINEKFAAFPFDQKIDSKNAPTIIIGSFVKSKKTVKNLHSTDMDTLILFKTKGDSIEFLKTKDREFFSSAVITDRNIKLSHGIQIGMTPAQVSSEFGYKGNLAHQNKLIVTDASEFYYHVFTFKNEKLIKITLDSGPE